MWCGGRARRGSRRRARHALQGTSAAECRRYGTARFRSGSGGRPARRPVATFTVGHQPRERRPRSADATGPLASARARKDGRHGGRPLQFPSIVTRANVGRRGPSATKCANAALVRESLLAPMNAALMRESLLAPMNAALVRESLLAPVPIHRYSSTATAPPLQLHRHSSTATAVRRFRRGGLLSGRGSRGIGRRCRRIWCGLRSGG